MEPSSQLLISSGTPADDVRICWPTSSSENIHRKSPQSWRIRQFASPSEVDKTFWKITKWRLQLRIVEAFKGCPCHSTPQCKGRFIFDANPADEEEEHYFKVAHPLCAVKYKRIQLSVNTGISLNIMLCWLMAIFIWRGTCWMFRCSAGYCSYSTISKDFLYKFPYFPEEQWWTWETEKCKSSFIIFEII